MAYAKLTQLPTHLRAWYEVATVTPGETHQSPQRKHRRTCVQRLPYGRKPRLSKACILHILSSVCENIQFGQPDALDTDADDAARGAGIKTDSEVREVQRRRRPGRTLSLGESDFTLLYQENKLKSAITKPKGGSTRRRTRISAEAARFS
ncbi:hypothetical protein FOXG_04680 [Fusarium oxysporum f. sp. lycopersici 4287]|uniref:Uncharacterized protein n=2 Tax=Fusarium oxysporum TaxID=5507 RepID=A0A0J9UR28_FUSO4|nr:hypothetical protein FOXG_04680 [Fusarium oxysporum f. sp. lycopersici 4287]KNB01433.1 hypothetical protein FOXG_04680 [Fusarium oxysporum f. sp. lycopersici 4287]